MPNVVLADSSVDIPDQLPAATREVLNPSVGMEIVSSKRKKYPFVLELFETRRRKAVESRGPLAPAPVF